MSKENNKLKTMKISELHALLQEKETELRKAESLVRYGTNNRNKYVQRDKFNIRNVKKTIARIKTRLNLLR